MARLPVPRFIAVCFTAVTLFAPQIVCAQSFTVTDLGTLPSGTFSTGYALNASGQVVGISTVAGSDHSFVFSANALTAKEPIGSLVSVAQAIDSNGDFAGYNTVTGNTSHAFVYMAGSFHDLGTLGGATSTAYGITNSGTVVGGSETPTSLSHAFLTHGTGPLTAANDLTPALPAGQRSAAYAVSNHDQATGFETVSGKSHAFYFDANGTVTDLGTLGGPTSTGWAINNSGTVAGEAQTLSGATHAFRHTGAGTLGAADDLGVPSGFTDSYGYGINSQGTVVGNLFNSGAKTYHAFVTLGGAPTDLNSLIPSLPGWTLIDAFGINDAGQIVGDGTINGQTHAYLLNPLASVVPEPSAALTLPLGFGLLALRRKFRRL